MFIEMFVMRKCIIILHDLSSSYYSFHGRSSKKLYENVPVETREIGVA
jgi:hypothetical protein